MISETKILLTRGSVCMADEVVSNDRVLYFSTEKTLSDLVKKILSINFLAQIYGGNATWVMMNENTKIAVVSQQWEKAKFFINENSLVSLLKVSGDSINIHFDYFVQEDPDIVFQNLISVK